MIKKLRRQFIAVIMSVVAVLTAAAFLGVLFSTTGNLHHEYKFMLREALTRMTRPDMRARPDARPMPIITVTAGLEGTVTGFNNQIFNFNDGDIQAVVRLALERGGTYGALGNYSLRYMLDSAADGTVRLAFMDNTMVTRFIGTLLRNSAVIGALTLLLFFAASVILSRWVVKPVERAWTSQRQFVADASHELKTPLTVILSSSALLREDGEAADEKTKVRLGNIQAEATRMKRLVDDLLSLARSDGFKNSRIFERLDFSAALLSAALRFEPVIFDMGKHFDYTVPEGLFVTGDAAALTQLFEILLDNACRHSAPGGSITVRAKTAARTEVCLEVANDSETIPKAELDRIFERFYRLDTSRNSDGYGLGLSIASAIAGNHGGSIRAESDSGRTVFTLILPAAR